MSEVESQDLAHTLHWQAMRGHHDALVQVIEQACHAYYDPGSPQMNDADYDRLFRKLEDIEREHPELAGVDLPTKSMRGSTRPDFATVHHPARMTSISDVFSFEKFAE